jgi:YggT family protein
MGIVCILLTLYLVILFARVILSWVAMTSSMAPTGPLRQVIEVVYVLTEPVLRPLRGVLPDLPIGVARIDLSPIIVFIVLGILRRFACG